jgi:predicted metalloprotease with PDZ domain
MPPRVPAVRRSTSWSLVALWAAGVAALPAGARPAGAQRPFRDPAEAVEARFDVAHPVLHYTLRVDPGDLTAFAVELRVRYAAPRASGTPAAPDTFRVAMAAHPEYDDRYWRYVEGMRVGADPGGDGPDVRPDVRQGAGPGALAVAREDSAVWRVTGARAGCSARPCVLRWRVRLPASAEAARAAWRPFLAPTGALVGGPHAFPFVVGAERAPAHVTLDLPAGWEAATGLVPTADPRTFFAPTADALVDAPVLAGRLRAWRFAVDGVPHRVVYWPAPNAAPFDTLAFVDGVRRVAEQAAALFGRPPWREYTFLFQDGAYGGLEHANSVTLGAPSAALGRDPRAELGSTAHEFLHAWNLVRIRPAEYGGVTWRAQPPTAGLWFSEGLTMFYADLLVRRAGLPAEEPTRAEHLAGLVARYLGGAGNARWSLEHVSRAEYNAPPEALGDAAASTHTAGELFGAVLDLRVRAATGGRRTVDDVMRLMSARFGGAARGFTGRDVERAVAEVCGCEVGPLFARHVRGRADGTRDGALDVAGALAPLGLRLTVAWDSAAGPDGRPSPDLRVWVQEQGGGKLPVLVVGDPAGAWARAGLHTGDRLLAMDGEAVRDWAGFRGRVRRLRVGDRVAVEVQRGGRRVTRAVDVTGYRRPVVRVDSLPGVGEGVRALRAGWMAGNGSGG